ncbi:MAG: hypothetical protein ACYC6M_15335 [Terriglobales bacterium]
MRLLMDFAARAHDAGCPVELPPDTELNAMDAPALVRVLRGLVTQVCAARGVLGVAE